MGEKVLLILGASSDLGVAFINSEIENYDHIIAHYNSNPTSLLLLQKKYPQKIEMKQADFSDKKNIEKFIDEIENGKIPNYIIHLPALKCKLRKFKKIPFEEFEKSMWVSLKSIFLILQKILPLMEKKQYGKIVFISSVYTEIGTYKYITDYIVVKSALMGLMKELALEYKDKGIRINGVSPDMIETKFISDFPRLAVENKKEENPSKCLLKVSDIVPVIAYLLDVASDHLYGENIRIT